MASHAISVMLFASLGKTSTNSGWNYVLALYIFLATIAITDYLTLITSRRSNLFKLISTLLSGALLGFYYGGIAADNNSQIAIIGAVLFSIIFALEYWRKSYFLPIIVTLIAAISAYGFAFVLITQAISLLSVAAIIPGAFWSIFGGIYTILATNLAIASINTHNN